ncbi:MAG: glycerophosphodiester phosphodiesterase [Polaromonas sp.]|jgi:glycerophosphoryl diester phosphodiesterase
MNHWYFPQWIAHRGAGQLAPENTLAAFKLGASHGYRMFECDVKLSSDGVPFLLHDDTLKRTSNGTGVAGQQTWQALQQLDAGSWHSAQYKGEPLPSLDTIAAYCISHGFDLNIEIKPTTGTDERTGSVVAAHAARLWQNESRKPLLSSFKPDALQAALSVAPELPRGLLLHELWTGWLETALMLGCVAIICNHKLWDTSSVTQAKSAGFKMLSYTVNDEADVQRLLALGTDGIITDRVELIKP